MNKGGMILIIIVMTIFIFLISGCHSNEKNPKIGYLNEDKPMNDERVMGNVTQGQNQGIPNETQHRPRMEGMIQENLKNACEGKSEGESCQFEEIKGTCGNMNGTLICRLERQAGQIENERR